MRERGNGTPAALTPALLRQGVDELARREPRFAGIVAAHGPPAMWDRPPGFPALVHIVLEQQVSLASARAAYDRVDALTGGLTPRSLLRLTDEQLRQAGFSRQKARYARGLATAVEDGTLDLPGLALLDDEAADAALRAVPGIGPWTAAIYRLSALGRPDAWPAGDLAVVVTIARLWRLAAPPGPRETTALAEAWRPWRAVAARLLWHRYLAVPRS